jgi:hypothetical protein
MNWPPPQKSILKFIINKLDENELDGFFVKQYQDGGTHEVSHLYISLDEPLMNALNSDSLFFVRDSEGNSWKIHCGGAGDLLLELGPHKVWINLEDWFEKNKSSLVCMDHPVSFIESFWEWIDHKKIYNYNA